MQAHAQATLEHDRVLEDAQRCAELRQRAEPRAGRTGSGAAEKALQEAALKLEQADQRLRPKGPRRAVGEGAAAAA